MLGFSKRIEFYLNFTMGFCITELVLSNYKKISKKKIISTTQATLFYTFKIPSYHPLDQVIYLLVTYFQKPKVSDLTRVTSYEQKWVLCSIICDVGGNVRKKFGLDFSNVVLQLMDVKKNKYIEKYACQRNVFLFYKKMSLMFRFIFQSAISKLSLLQ